MIRTARIHIAKFGNPIFMTYTVTMQFNNFDQVFKDWIKSNHISDKVVEDFGISFNSYTGDIIIPISDTQGNFIFNKYRRNPLSSIGPKYRYDVGGKISLYGYHIAKNYDAILITEGEKDCLVAWSHNIPAVTSTGGALSFQKEWVDLLKDKDITICLDNDKAGGQGVVRLLSFFPNAKVVCIPEVTDVKDISDYVNSGKDLRVLMQTAQRFETIEDVEQDRIMRKGRFETNTYFHNEYIKAHTRLAPDPSVVRHTTMFESDSITRAKQYPISNLLEFNGKNMCICPFHNERTPSLHYYKKTNSCYCFGGCGRAYDAINIYMHIHNVSFSDAVKELNKLL